MTETDLLESRRNEFRLFTWDHAADAFQMSFDERRELSGKEIETLKRIHEAILLPDDHRALSELRSILLEDSERISLALQIVGLTRNKIISDMRGSAAAIRQGISVPSNFKGIVQKGPWTLAGPYLLKRYRAVLGLVDPKNPTPAQCYQALNQSTWPGYIRQERAKRSGHEAESRLAGLMFSLGIPFAPAEKADNPMCPDVQLDEISFDLVIPGADAPKVVFKSTVHTANIGQYGESKDHLEIDEARRWIDSLAKADRPLLMAFIDGVGFQSNSAGLNGVLLKADEFCQFRTIWKAVIVADFKLGIRRRILLPQEIIDRFSAFIERYDYAGHCRPKETASERPIGYLEAGDALVEAASSNLE